jgi:hypothetical protein
MPREMFSNNVREPKLLEREEQLSRSAMAMGSERFETSVFRIA